MRSFRALRMQRLRHDITARLIADNLGVSDGWIRSLEKNRYRGPCVDAWYERYQATLNLLINEKKAAKR